jgi:hypothetical protein
MKLSINWLLVFIPISLAVEHLGRSPPPQLMTTNIHAAAISATPSSCSCW